MLNNYKLMEEVMKNPKSIAKHINNPDWRVRYAAAVAIGELRDKKYLPLLCNLLRSEGERPLYTQPAVLGYENSYDDTRMAEQLVPIKEIFDKEYPEDMREAWRCRGRVRQACIFAIRDVGKATDEVLKLLHTFLIDPKEDYAVKAASAMALGSVGHDGSIPYLEKLMELDEWCCQCEAKKALRRLKGGKKS